MATGIAVNGSRWRLEQILAGQRYPAARWELIARAEYYGADTLSKRELYELPAARFRSLADVLDAVTRRRITSDSVGTS